MSKMVQIRNVPDALHRRAKARAAMARRHPARPLLPRIWELREALTAYDATYVALAEALGAPLLTLDRGLLHAPTPGSIHHP